MLKSILLIGTGSFIGGVTRFILGRFIQSSVYSSFPWGTFTVNILGCLLIGLLYGLSSKVHTEWKLFLVVGLCGGFTTFSTFSIENLELLKQGNFFQFFLYSSMSVLVALVATWGGYMLTRSMG
jgi:fluoride exporter